MDIVKSAILGVVEGITEFIPVSSTGHLILAAKFLKFEGSAASTFEVFIQLGAILAVIILYRKTFQSFLKFDNQEEFSGLRGLELLFWTTLPALVFGAAAHGTIKKYLFSSATVAIGLGIGGLAIVLCEQFLGAHKKSGLNSLNRKDAFLIGLFQCLALWPGMSRSACTILGAMLIGVERKTAVEYSFLAAAPVMFAATAFDLAKNVSLLSHSDFAMFATGFIFAFVSAWAAIRFFVRVVAQHTLKAFGWYRILVSSILISAGY